MSSAERWHWRVAHIVEAIEAITSYVAGMDEAAFAADRRTIDAVLRNFQVIGEAARKIPKDVRERHPALPWSEMEKMRHKIVHDYDRISVPTVWRTIVDDLAPLHPLLTQLLAEAKDVPDSR
jgi:uncharacterized protein with HEPN domain